MKRLVPGILLWAGFAAMAAAEEVSLSLPTGHATATYGGHAIVTTTPASGFGLFAGFEFPYDFMNNTRQCSFSPCRYLAPLQLPSGARIESIELTACDLDPFGEITFNVLSQAKPMQTPLALLFPPPTTGAGQQCTTHLAGFAPAPVIDNNANSYLLEVTHEGSPLAIMNFQSVRVSYRLEVSPAPAVATFADVPTTHNFFRFIEALAAAGITGGCSPPPSPNYCPDAPITRGQMAVFLSAALGLHFPN